MQRKILYTTLLFICLLLGIIFFWWPKYKNFNNLKLEIKEKKIELENKERYFSELNSVFSRLKDYNLELAKIDSALPQSFSLADLLNFLTEKSSQSGLILERVNIDKISPLQQDSKIKKISLNLSFSGFYPNLKNFLFSIQNSAKLIEVDEIKFSSPKEGESFSFDLKIETYSY